LNPYLKKHENRLLKREEERERYLRRQENATKRNLAKAAMVGVGATALVHTAHPRGIAGAVNDVAASVISTKRAGSDVKQYISRSTTTTDMFSRTMESPKRFANKFSDELGKLNSIGGDNIAIEKTRISIKEGLNELRYEQARQKRYDYIEEQLKKMEKEGGEVTQENIQKLRNRYGSRLADMAAEIGGKSSTSRGARGPAAVQSELSRAGFNEDQQDAIRKLLRDSYESVDVDSDDFARKQQKFRERIIENIIERRQKDLNPSRVSVTQKAKDAVSSKIRSAFGYRQATARDLIKKHNSTESAIELNEETLRFLKEIEQSGGDMRKFVPDENLLIDGSGRIVNTRSTSKVKDAFDEVTSSGIIGRVMLKQRPEEDQPMYILRSGKHQPFLSDIDEVDDNYRLQETMVGIGDQVFKLSDPSQPVKQGLQFTSGRYGTMKRLGVQMSGIETKEDDYVLGKFGKTLGLEKQKHPGIYTRVKSAFTKGKDEDYLRNKIARLYAGEEFDRDLAYDVFDTLRVDSPAPDKNLLNAWTNQLDDTVLNANKFETQEDLVNAYVRLQKDLAPTGKLDYIDDTDKYFKDKAYNILSRSRVRTRKGFAQSNELETGEDILRKRIGGLLSEREGYTESAHTLSKLRKQGVISQAQKQAGDMTIGTQIFEQGLAQNSINFDDSTKRLFRGTGDDVDILRESLTNMAKETRPRFGYGNLGSADSIYRGDTLAMNKMTDLSPSSILNTFTAGRGNMHQAHRGTMKFYGVATRINNLAREIDVPPFNRVSVGLPDEDMGSSGAFAKNVMLKRVLPVAAGYTGVKWANDHLKDITGYTGEQHYERAKASTRFKVADIKESLGIQSAIEYMDRVTPGSEGVESAFYSVPFIGWGADITGITSTKTREDWIDYYRHGTDPVRKSRWWPLGSTPWMGEEIAYHKPNSYKMAMAEPEYTSTVWGDREQYWSHHWMPTPSNPLSPIRRFVTDPYWWEEYHKERRPYPRSGSLFGRNTPWGPILNQTIGKVLKPTVDYGAGADESTIRRLEQEEEYDSAVIPVHKGGTVKLKRYIPKSGMNTRDIEKIYKEGKIAVSAGGEVRETASEGIVAGGRNQVGIYKGGQSKSAQQATIGELEISDAQLANIKKSRRLAGDKATVIGGEGLPIHISSGHGIISKHPVQGEAIKTAGTLNTDRGQKGTVNLGGQEIRIENIQKLNQALRNNSGGVSDLDTRILEQSGYFIDYRQPWNTGTLDKKPQEPDSISMVLDRLKETMYRMPGATGFMTRALVGDTGYGEGEVVLESAEMAYAESNRFNRSGLGGRGMRFSEVARRFMQPSPGLRETVNRRPNTMPRWLPDRYTKGDPYRKVQGGAIRLPGEAYESLNKLHPDEFGKYGAVDRAAILADVAPWSDQYKMWLDIARSKDLSPESEAFLQRRLKRSRKQREPFHITEYEFLGKNTNKKETSVIEWVDENRFRVENGETTYRIAGVYGSFSDESKSGSSMLEVLEETMMPGSDIRIATPQNHPGYSDDMASVPAVVYSDGVNVSKKLREAGVKEREESSVIENEINLGKAGKAIGSAWELFSHSEIPVVSNKIVNVDSALEKYKKSTVYGKDYQSWTKPVDDLAKPTMRMTASKHPLTATMTGAFAGAVTGVLTGGSYLTKPFAAIGAVAGLGFSFWRINKEQKSGDAWIPDNIEKRREMQEYFDKLKYVKNSMLYNRYKKLAKEKEGTNISKIVEEMERTNSEIKNEREKLQDYVNELRNEDISKEQSVKQFINEQGRIEKEVQDTEDYIDKRKDKVDKRINQIKNKEVFASVGPLAKRALMYRDRMESTMVAIDSDSTFTQMIRALPDEEKDYFRYFANIHDPEKQQKILKYLPEEVGEVYKHAWGLEYDEKDVEKIKLEDYFDDYHLPNEDWAGWEEGVDLSISERKLLEEEGFDPKDFGFWEQNTKEEELTPSPVHPGDSYKSQNLSQEEVQKLLEDIMKEHDIEDIEIMTEPSEEPGINIDMNIGKDLRADAERQLENVLMDTGDVSRPASVLGGIN